MKYKEMVKHKGNILMHIVSINLSLQNFPVICSKAETNDFAQPTACGAPVGWSKYTTSKTLVKI